MKDLSIIIVNWNSAEYIRKCLSSIFRETKNLDFEVIVVDNASYDGCEQIVRHEFCGVVFVQSDKNLGFAGANNLGFRHSKGKALLFLNPDTEIIGAAINDMLSHLTSLNDAGAVGCRLLNSDMSLQTSCIMPFPTILNQVLDTDYLKLLFPKMGLWGIKPLFSDGGPPEPVEVISGACMMIKRDVFEKVGLFSADYFMYSEDVDLCYKINEAGYKIYHVSDAKVIHHGGRSTSQKNENHFGAVLIRESIFNFLTKTKGRTYAQLYKVSMTFIAFTRLAVLLLLSPWLMFTTKKDAIYHTMRKWGKVLRWSLGLEKWCKDRHFLTGAV
ncbi:MAG TPA: glycosyltransferase family 2 protein [Syntrophales bacterium]|nr:glycosyltransferase family 2 protein [Syntrophales bacterium]